MAQNAIRVLRGLGLVDYGCQFQRTGRLLLVPLVRELTDNEIALMRKQIGEVKILSAAFPESVEKPRNLASSLRGQVPDHLMMKLPRSFDVIGDIAVIELPDRMDQYSSVIGQGILKINPHVRLALRKSSKVSGTFRTRKFDIIAGVGDTETVYQEFSCCYHLDLSTVYFNPRLSHERMRVAQQVNANELLVDMFAGVGPYSILIAKRQLQSTVYSVDLNPVAIKYLKENAFTNGVADRVIPLLGDARELAQKALRGIADRVIMNLPSEAKNYLPTSLKILKDEGGMIHFYAFANREESTEAVKSAFRIAVEAQDRRIELFRFCEVIKEVATNRVQVAIDALVK